MAGILSRAAWNLSRLSRPALVTVTSRAKGTMMPDPMEHATGLERKELEAIARGNPDPFMMQVKKRGPGTKEQPNLVESVEEMRLVGCICEEDTFHINFLWVYRGEPKRCGECGAWYKLVDEKDPFKDLPEFHAQI
ncbi:unnamed protein product [Allacma fusca]|uniref:Cytochrome c oxidase subunit 5B, mitochondrial n=1 Tax=Allacma fusca TaxID=39272 RepID=A0A8J2K278_9HEXA|nr:unnamed protein product [Allacma fusca]